MTLRTLYLGNEGIIVYYAHAGFPVSAVDLHNVSEAGAEQQAQQQKQLPGTELAALDQYL